MYEQASELREVGAKLELAKLLCVRIRLAAGESRPDAAGAALVEAEALAAEVRARPDSDLGRKLAEARTALDGA